MWWLPVVCLIFMTSLSGDMKENRPKVGVGVVVEKDGKILLGLRKGSHGADLWAFPGGHLEFGETIEECAARELFEETGLRATSLHRGSWVSDVMNGAHHYITFFVHIDSFEGEVELKEPEKCSVWNWCSQEDITFALFPAVASYFQQKQSRDLSALLEKMLEFYQERNWEQFHSPKNLVMNLATEVGELVEPFRWVSEEQSYELPPETLEAVKDEIADVFQNILYLSHKLGIDPVEATFEKLKKMAVKYPAEACYGKSLKYTAYEQVAEKK